MTNNAAMNIVEHMSFCKAKDTVNNTKQQPTERKNIFTHTIVNRRLISKIYKELKKLVIKRKIIQ